MARDPRSTSRPSGIGSGAFWIASEPRETQERFLESLTPEDAEALLYAFDFWAMPHQVAPEGDWRTWVILGGRGAGKTRAGAEWVRAMVEGERWHERGQARRVALIGETIDQAREVMVFGDSGLLECSPPDRRPVWEAGRGRLIWPNGAVAQVFSAFQPEALRGPQFDACWADELAKWPKAQATWDMLQFGLRLGDDPRACVTTTPRNVPVLKRLLGLPSTVSTHAPTEANAQLARSFLEEVRARYGGSFLGRQELDGVLIDDVPGALWPVATVEAARVAEAPELSRIVVAVDPPVSGHKGSDACGIVVAGVVAEGPPQAWTAYVLADVTVQGVSPDAWAQVAVDAYRRFEADRLVAEVNQGGNLVEAVIRQKDPSIPYKAVRASRGKTARAEPVAALYEQGRVKHLPGLQDLEDQMRAMGRVGFEGQGSPDRVDALVWAITELMWAGTAPPSVRVLG
ncbi:MAG: terminase family protein [Pseudomonadota bacterium]